jgi:DNA (cytosine-5)-methyltransferase 1
MKKPTFYEFFAGGGMARAGLEPAWSCLFANDIEPLKAATYTRNWGEQEFVQGDIGELQIAQLPGKPDLAWASFPCQDLSVAGVGLGLNGKRSAAFWAYCDLLSRLVARRKAPKILVLENVPGALTSRGGRDFVAICSALSDLGYRFGALLIDAAHFVPQSRPRLFVVAVKEMTRKFHRLSSTQPIDWCTSKSLTRAYEKLPRDLQEKWIWWRLPEPPKRRTSMTDIIRSGNEAWHSRSETKHLLALMTRTHRGRITQSRNRGTVVVGTLFRRMRKTQNGTMQQRAEIRVGDVAGCLRTPSGGSSRQVVVAIQGDTILTRLIGIREGARLMGLPRRYKLPTNYYDAFKVLGDGLAVPLVRFLSKNLLLPLIKES